MVVKCSIFGCSNRKDRENDLEFYRLPAITINQREKHENLCRDRRRLWLANIGQNFENKNLDNVRVCSAHFISGKKADLYDALNPDWAPTVNLGTGRKRTHSGHDRYARQQKRFLMTSSVENESHSELAPMFEEPMETGVSCQTDITNDLMVAMTEELQLLRPENHELRKLLAVVQSRFEPDFFKDNDDKVKHLTGLPKFTTLMILFEFMQPYLPSCLVMSKFKAFTMTLIKLRLNLSNVFLAYEFETTQRTVSHIFTGCISALYQRRKKLIKWPERETLQKTMPMEFRKTLA